MNNIKIYTIQKDYGMKIWGNLKKYFNSSLKKSHILVGVVLSFITFSGILYAVQMATLTTFSQNTVISSSEINANFQNLNNAIRESHNIKVAYIQPFAFSDTEEQLSFSLVTNYGDTQSGLNNQLIIPEDGYYDLIIRGQCNDPTSDGTPIITWRHNDGTYDGLDGIESYHLSFSAFSGYMQSSISFPLSFTANDNIKLFGKNNVAPSVACVLNETKSYIYLKKVF